MNLIRKNPCGGDGGFGVTPLVLFTVLLHPCVHGLPVPAGPEGSAPSTVILPIPPNANFVSFENPSHPGNRIGYRIHEQLPLVAGSVSIDLTFEPGESKKMAQMEEHFRAAKGVVVHERPVREEGWVPQDWIYYFEPVADGIKILWVIRTHNEGINEYYAAQQCFRMSGRTNSEWRRKIAETPAFSEYDFWAELREKNLPMKSLSYFHRSGNWEVVPATTTRVVARTPAGRALEGTGPLRPETVLRILDPNYEGFFLEDVKDGLMVRTDSAGEWVCGIYWERTTHVSNHHPADCLHATVNLGPIPPYGKRVIRGRIYWFRGSKEDLADRWKKEFPFD